MTTFFLLILQYMFLMCVCLSVCLCVCVSSQPCRAYEQFMIDVARLIRTDRSLEVNETQIREEVTRVIELEREIANVSSTLLL